MRLQARAKMSLFQIRHMKVVAGGETKHEFKQRMGWKVCGMHVQAGAAC